MAGETIKYVNTDSERWGSGEERPLTSLEVDENFYSVDQRLEALEANPPLPEGIESIDVVGNQMTFLMTDGTVFGPYTLPTAAFNFTGEWQPLTNYEPYDLFTAENGLYMVLTAFESATEFNTGAELQFLLPFAVVYSIGFFAPQKPGEFLPAATAALFSFVGDRDWYLPENAPGSVARLRTGSENPLTFVIKYNEDDIGAIFFSAGSTTGTVTCVETQFNAGDVLRVIVPDPVDSLATDLVVTFSGRIGLA